MRDASASSFFSARNSNPRTPRRRHNSHYELFDYMRGCPQHDLFGNTRGKASCSSLGARCEEGLAQTDALEVSKGRRLSLPALSARASKVVVLPNPKVAKEREAMEATASGRFTAEVESTPGVVTFASDVLCSQKGKGETDEGHRDAAPLLTSREPSFSEPRQGGQPLSTRRGISAEQRDTCEVLRLVVLGGFGFDEGTPGRERERLILLPADREDISTLIRFWFYLDEDSNERVDFGEWHRVMRKQLPQTIPCVIARWPRNSTALLDAPKILKTLCNADHPVDTAVKLADKAIKVVFGKRGSFGLQDLMRVLWPGATPAELKQMQDWAEIERSHVVSARVATPPVQSASDYEDLRRVFESLDVDGSGDVSWEELVATGLLDEEDARRLIKDWGDQSGSLREFEFIMMMTQSGLRASEEAKIATDSDGGLVMYDPAADCWLRCPLDGRPASDSWRAPPALA